MKAYKIEILNPKALRLIKGMQDLNLIKLSDEPTTALRIYLKKIRRRSSSAPSLDEITQMVEEVREQRYAKKWTLKNYYRYKPLDKLHHF